MISGSHLEIILSQRDIGQCLETFLVFTTCRVEYYWRLLPGRPLNILQCTGQPFNKKLCHQSVSSAEVEKPGLDRSFIRMMEKENGRKSLGEPLKKGGEGGTTQNMGMPGDVRFKDVYLCVVVCERMQESLFGRVHGELDLWYKSAKYSWV